jgi:hypothetical protein
VKFQLTINLGNAAMQDNHDVAKALRAVADRLSKFTSTGWSPYALDGKIKDDNGNTVGSWEVKPEVECIPSLGECSTCIGVGRIRDADSNELRRCLDCGGDGLQAKPRKRSRQR